MYVYDDASGEWIDTGDYSNPYDTVSNASSALVYNPTSNSWVDPQQYADDALARFNQGVEYNSYNGSANPSGPPDAAKTVTFPDGSQMFLDANGNVVGAKDAPSGTENTSGIKLSTTDRIQLLAQGMGGLASSGWKNLVSAFTKSDGTTDWGKLLGAAAGLGQGLGIFGSSDQKPKGYQGTVPKLDVARQQVANTYDPTRRPGSSGLRYFTDTQFVPQGDTAALTTAQTTAGTQATGLASLNAANPAKQTTSALKFAPLPSPGAAAPATTTTTPAAAAAPASAVINQLPVPTYDKDNKLITGLNAGGIATLARGTYLDGPTDGMADKLPANIDGKQEARLSHGEFVIPADVVSHLGNGNSSAGAQRLYAMMDRIRQARTGTKKQGKEINPDKYVPA
jgi:hypothetical protein